MDTPFAMWSVFFAIVIATLALDLGLLKREREPLTVRQALLRSMGFIALALAFNAFVYYERGPQAASEFFTGYLIELSLSVDNLFVFLLIFTHFGVPREYQHRVLLWGILGAVLMRGVMIWLGDSLVERFAWIMYLFGGFLIITGIKMFFAADAEPDVTNNILIRWMRNHCRITSDFMGERFFVKLNHQRWMTPLFMVLVLIEISDLIFAVDSIPAIFAVTRDGYVVYTSNIFAILGLRSLYFALAAFIHRFEYLKYGLSLILVFIGGKMLVNHHREATIISTEISLAVVVLVILTSVIVSLIKTRKRPAAALHRGWVPGSANKESKGE